MLKNILLSEYKNLLNDIINEYKKFMKENNGYYNYFKIINHEVKLITNAFNLLISQKKNTFKSIFEDEYESVLHAIDEVLFKHIETIFENVSLLLNTK